MRKASHYSNPDNSDSKDATASRYVLKLSPASKRLNDLSKEIDSAVKTSAVLSKADKNKHGGTPRNFFE